MTTLACCDTPDPRQLSARFWRCQSCRTENLLTSQAAPMLHDHTRESAEPGCPGCDILLCSEQVGQDEAEQPVWCPRGATGSDGHCDAHRAALMAMEARVAADQAEELRLAAARVQIFLNARQENGIADIEPEDIQTIFSRERGKVATLLVSDLTMLIESALLATEVS